MWRSFSGRSSENTMNLRDIITIYRYTCIPSILCSA
nr:MAG TPA: hypothetical protein [Caudoviricetes sp.]